MSVLSASSARAVDLGDLLSHQLPDTCEAPFWDTLKARAWEEGQRQVTQNANLLAKPDSVLTYSCFDQHLNHLTRYSSDNFPEDPDESFDESFFGNLGWIVQTTYLDLFGALDPYGTKGLDMESVLEVLILDTIMSDVSYLQIISGSTDDTILGLLSGTGFCSRNYYIEFSTYHHPVLGGRKTTTYSFPNDLSNSNYSCGRMAAVWEMAKCYNAVSEPSHDGFFQLPTYASTGGDYRTLLTKCSASVPHDTEYYAGLLCDFYFHGTPAIPVALYWPWSGTPPLDWATAHGQANPLIGTGGASSPLDTFQPLYEPSNCTSQAPIKTGVVVKNGADTYDDAYCMAPGCWYNPAVSLTQCQPL